MPTKTPTPKRATKRRAVVESDDSFDEEPVLVVKKPSADVPKSASTSTKGGRQSSAEKKPPKQETKPSKSETKLVRQPSDVTKAATSDTMPTKRPKPSTDSEFGATKKTTTTTPTSSTQSSASVQQHLPWVDKHRPTQASQLVGQNGDRSPWNKLLFWLREWHRNHLGEAGKVKRPRPPPWMNDKDGSPFRAILLSGPPGIGKTTCAVMACKELGLECIEMNASDVRNKRTIQMQLGQLTSNHQLEQFQKGQKVQEANDPTRVHHVLIMDEVDGMSGNEDRAGLAELIQMIKTTKIPIICICNDRSNMKMRTLVSYCYDVRFPRPRVEQIRSRLMAIASREGIQVTSAEVDELIESSAQDVRQSIYNLQLRAATNGRELVKESGVKREPAPGIFDAARKLMHGRSPFAEKLEMFFVDYNLMSLFVAENYPQMCCTDSVFPGLTELQRLRRAAKAVACGDLVEKMVRGAGQWKLLPVQGAVGCAYTSSMMGGHMTAMIGFPGWLSKNSTAQRRQRIATELGSHAHLTLSSTDKRSIVLDYAPALRDAITLPLQERENDAIPEVIERYVAYALQKDDAEALLELAAWPGGRPDPSKSIPAKVKAALTRALNKESRLLPYALDDMVKGGRRKAAGRGGADATEELDEDGHVQSHNLGGDDDEEAEEDEGDDDDNAPATSSKSTPAPSRSGSGAKSGGAAPAPAARSNSARGAGGGRGSAGRGRGRGRGK